MNAPPAVTVFGIAVVSVGALVAVWIHSKDTKPTPRAAAQNSTWAASSGIKERISKWQGNVTDTLKPCDPRTDMAVLLMIKFKTWDADEAKRERATAEQLNCERHAIHVTRQWSSKLTDICQRNSWESWLSWEEAKLEEAFAALRSGYTEGDLMDKVTRELDTARRYAREQKFPKPPKIQCDPAEVGQ